MNYGVGARGIKWKGRRGGGRINMKDSRFSLEPGRARLRNVSILKQKIFWNTPQKVSSTKCFGAVRQNNFDGKSWYLPPLLSFTFFDTRNFLRHRRVSLRKFSVLWGNKLSTENRDIPLLCIKFFDTGFFLKHRSVPLWFFSGTVRQKLSTENRFCIKYRNQKWNWCLWKPLKNKFKTISSFLTACKSYSEYL